MAVDYKYRHSLQELVDARFKGIAYLYELNVNATIIVAPPIRTYRKDTDEEATQQKGFYEQALQRGGTIIEIDRQNKIFAIAVIEPIKEKEKLNKNILQRTLSLIFLNSV